MIQHQEIQQLVLAENMGQFSKFCESLHISSSDFSKICKRLQLSDALLQIPNSEISLQKISALVRQELKQFGLNESNHRKRQARQERKRAQLLAASDSPQTTQSTIFLNDHNLLTS